LQIDQATSCLKSSVNQQRLLAKKKLEDVFPVTLGNEI